MRFIIFYLLHTRSSIQSLFFMVYFEIPDFHLIMCFSAWPMKSIWSTTGNQEQGVIEPLPKHLQAQERVPLQENAETIFEKTAMGAASFSLFLHQNCLAFFSDIDNIGQALQHLTDADVLAAEWTVC